MHSDHDRIRTAAIKILTFVQEHGSEQTVARVVTGEVIGRALDCIRNNNNWGKAVCCDLMSKVIEAKRGYDAQIFLQDHNQVVSSYQLHLHLLTSLARNEIFDNGLQVAALSLLQSMLRKADEIIDLTSR